MTEFAKKTGDYSTLSATDIKVMALTYQLEVEANGCEHLKTEPTVKKTIVVAPKPPGPRNVETLAGFYMPKSTEVDLLAEKVEGVSIQGSELNPESVDNLVQEDIQETRVSESNEIPSESLNDDQEYETDEEEELTDEEEEDDDSDGGGWITPGNIEQVKHSMTGVTETVQLDVACLTTDFAMQVN